MMEQQLVEEISRALRDALMTPAGPGEEKAEQPYNVPPPVINVYVVNAPVEEEWEEAEPEEPVIESSFVSEPEPEADPIRTSFVPRHARWPRCRWWLMGLCLLALLAGVGATFLSPLLLPSAQVTIMPISHTLITSSTITIVTSGPANPGKGEVAGRTLSTLQLSQQRSLPTTGSGAQAAQAAQGLVTFYNALPLAQSIPAGTLLTGADGVQVVTDQSVLIAAGTGVMNGSVSVSAHALQAGPAGNIAAFDLDGTCCRAYVLVKNRSAFRGGQNARTYQAVSQHDLDGATASLKTALAQSVQAAFEAQVHPEETLLLPVPCTTQVKSDHPVGAQASQVSVTVSETCTAMVYQRQQMQALLSRAQQQQATAQWGAGSVQTGALAATLTSSKGEQGAVLVQVQAKGTWLYQFSEAQLHQFASLMAGKSKQQATTLLLGEPGVQQVTISMSNGDALPLPTSAQRIEVAVLYSPPQGG